MTVSELCSALAAYPSDAPVYVLACRVDDDGHACGPAGLDFPLPRTIHVPDPEDEAAGEMLEAVLLDAEPPADDAEEWIEPYDDDPSEIGAW